MWDISSEKTTRCSDSTKFLGFYLLQTDKLMNVQLQQGNNYPQQQKQMLYQ